MSITTKQIAEIAKVSQSTVSRCLNNSPFVSEKTKRKVLKIAQEHGFQFNANARSLSTNKTYTIGVIISRIQTDYGLDINFRYWLDEFMKKLGRFDYDIIVSLFDESSSENSIKKFISAKKVDGLVLLIPEIDHDTAAFLENSEVPFIICKFMPDAYKSKEVDYVYVNQFKGGYLAGDHLIKLGHQNILCISADVGGDEFKQRTEGFKAALADHSVEYNERLVLYGNTTFKSGQQLIKENMHLLKDVTAIFAQNDLMALGAISVLKDEGIEVPKEIAVVGFDDIEMCEFFRPYLTTVQQSATQLAELTCDRLVSVLNSDKDGVKQTIAIEPKLIVRESCGSVVR